MGAQFELLNPMQAIIWGPTKLRGAAVNSCDIRAGAGMIIAGLAAEGITEISDIKYINRGYERLEEKMNSLGAKMSIVYDDLELKHQGIRTLDQPVAEMTVHNLDPVQVQA